jgi:peptidoglycan/LPS O-acetylase OafA/YrhL
MKRLMKSLLWLMFGVVAAKIILTIGVNSLEPFVPEAMRHRFTVLKMFVHTFTLESMAIGGIGAYTVFFRKQRLLDIVFHPVVQVIMGLCLVGFLLLKDRVFTLAQPFSPAIVSLVFVTLILNVSCNKNFLLKLDAPILNSLGRISYGIYMFHPLVIFPCILLLNKTGWNRTLPLAYNIVLHLAVVSLTLAVSYFSYQYFEAPWLNLKKRFARVPSGGAADGAPSGSDNGDGAPVSR